MFCGSAPHAPHYLFVYARLGYLQAYPAAARVAANHRGSQWNSLKALLTRLLPLTHPLQVLPVLFLPALLIPAQLVDCPYPIPHHQARLPVPHRVN